MNRYFTAAARGLVAFMVLSMGASAQTDPIPITTGQFTSADVLVRQKSFYALAALGMDASAPASRQSVTVLLTRLLVAYPGDREQITTSLLSLLDTENGIVWSDGGDSPCRQARTTTDLLRRCDRGSNCT